MLQSLEQATGIYFLDGELAKTVQVVPESTDLYICPSPTAAIIFVPSFEIETSDQFLALSRLFQVTPESVET